MRSIFFANLFCAANDQVKSSPEKLFSIQANFKLQKTLKKIAIRFFDVFIQLMLMTSSLQKIPFDFLFASEKTFMKSYPVNVTNDVKFWRCQKSYSVIHETIFDTNI